MKTPLIYLIGIVVVLGGLFFLFNKSAQQKAPTIIEVNDSEKTAEHIPQEKAEGQGNEPANTINQERYMVYSQPSFDAALDKKRVYFFHASWCSTCKAANDEFTSQRDTIPSDVMLFKTDYDTENELKRKYNVTYQHTFVYVDQNNKEIKKWNGGGIEELIVNTK